MNIEWVEELPQPKNGHFGAMRKTLEFIEQLKTRPGVWAIYKELDRPMWSQSSQYRKNYPGTEWAQRTVNGKGYVYARWVGETNV
jgi:hypothetical protein